MKTSERIGLLMFKYMRNELSQKEMRELRAWRNKSPKYETAFQEATDWENVQADLQWSAENSQAILEKVKKRSPRPWQKVDKKPKAKVRRITRFLRAAAIWTSLVMFIIYRYSVTENAHPHPGTYAGMIGGSPEIAAVPIIHDIIGGYKAGKAHLTVLEHDNGDMEYIATNNPKLPHTLFDLPTYRGNAFILHLPRMGSIWVNASTTIWYPAKFYGDTLHIKLTGEAYFQMEAHKPVVIEIPSTVPATMRDQPSTAIDLPSTVNRHPSTLIRESGNFNIHAYPSDSLKVGRDEQSVAWKNKMIIYRDASLKTILDEISRWYDVDVEYVEYGGGVPDKKFYLRVSRNAELSDVIGLLKVQGAKLFVNGKKIFVL